MRHFIDLTEWSPTELADLLQLAVKLKDEWRSGGNQPVLAGKMLGLIFQKPSLRTRVSFEVAMYQLGGASITLLPQEIGLGKRESVPDVSRVFSSYVQGIMARVFDHSDVEQLAAYSHVPVINGLSDTQHPCQAMADILTIYEHFGSLDGLRVAFVGDGNNVARSLGQAVVSYGMDFVIATPAGFGLPEDALDQIGTIAAQTGAQVEVFETPEAAVAAAHVVYTDAWVSMGQEAETQQRLPLFQPYQVNADLVAQAGGDAIVMHCLPAHRGWEITDEVADGEQSVVFQQAENRLHAQKAILVTLLADD